MQDYSEKQCLSLKPHILFYSNGLAIRYDFLDIMHIKVNNDFKIDIFLNGEFFQGIPHTPPPSTPETEHFIL